METIHLKSDVRIKAASAAKSPRVEIVAYTGGVMNVANFGHVVIDLAGLVLGDSTTLLSDHDADLGGVIGSGRARVEGGKLIVSGTLARSSETAQRIIALCKEGVAFQASVGVETIKIERGVRAIMANGRKHVGKPTFTYVRTGRLREITVCALGADPETAVAIAARRKTMIKRNNQQATVTEPDGGDEIVTDPADNDVQAERQRVAGFSRILARYPGLPVAKGHELHAQATEEGWTADQLELAMLRAERPQMRATFSADRSADRTGKPADVLTAALMLHSGRADLAEKSYGEHVAQQGAELRAHSLVDLCGAALRLDLRDVPRDRNELLRAAISTSSLPTALGNLASKSAAEAFHETPQIWRTLCRRRNVNNFHEHSIARVLLVGNYAELPPGGQLHHGSRTETTKTVRAATRGMMLGIDRQHIVNDDIGAFNDTSVALALAAARTANDDFINIILGNAGAFFHASNNNLGTSGTALAAAALAAAIASMAKRTDAEGRIIDVRPRYLLTPPELEFTADQILSSAEVQRYVTSAATDSAPTGNPLQARLDRLTEPRLSSTGYTGNSATAYYLFAAPQAGAVNVALLGGRDTPTIEQSDLDFNMLGIQFRAFIDYGFALGEPAAAHKATGAA
ncbi:MAG: Mu-like prophage major head subunit gpT family protein [Tepidisphaeraceae bacterium]